MRYLVEVSPGRLEEVQRALRALGIRAVKKVLNYISVEMPEAMVARVEALPGVVRVVPERTYRVAAVIPVEKKLQMFLRFGGPVNPMALTWAAGFRKDRWPTSQSRKVLGADEADRMGVDGRGVKVAVIDTGFDLLGCPQKPVIDYVYSTIEAQPVGHDGNGHGTHCLTTIAGGRFPTPWGWLEGVAKGVRVAAIKCLGFGIGTGATSDVMEAIVAAYNWGAKVVSMSLGTTVAPGERHDPDTCPLCSLVKALSERGVLFIVAAGNDGEGYASCPGVSEGAITVAALDKNLRVADFSSRNHPDYEERQKPDVAAPGVDIGSATCGLIDVMEWVDGPKLGFISGTSMATPHVAGLVALWVEYLRRQGVPDSEINVALIRDIIRRYGRGWDSVYGYGVPKFSWVVQYYEEVLR